MTNREMFVAVAAGKIDEEVMAKAAEELVKMDAANAKRREAPKKVSEETLAKRAAIFGALTSEPQTAAQIAEITGYSKNTISGVLRAYVADGSVVKSDVKVAGEDGKSKDAKAYALAE